MNQGSFKLAWVALSRRKKQTVGNVLLLSLGLLVLFFSITATHSMHYFTDVALNASVDFRSFWVDSLQDESVETTMANLKKIPHVQSVYPQVDESVSPSSIGASDDAQYWVCYKGAIAETLPTIVNGRGFQAEEQKVAVIPEDFRLETYVDTQTGKTKAFRGADLIGKTLSFAYKNGAKTMTFTVVGTYDSESVGADYRDVWVPYTDLYALGHSKSEIKSYTVVADSFYAVDSLEKTFQENYTGQYSAWRVFTFHLPINELRDFLDIFTALLLAALALFSFLNITMTVFKSIKLRTREFGLLKAVGYTNGDVYRITALEMVLVSIISLLVTATIAVLCLILLRTFETDINAFLQPLTIHSPYWIWPILAAAALILPQLSALFALPKIIRISPAQTLREE